MKRVIHRSGYSLVETLVYLAVVALVTVVIIQAIVNIVRPLSSLRVAGNTLHAASVSFERMTREIRSAASIDAASVFGASPGSLVLDTGIMFSVTDGVLTVRDAGGIVSPLTSGVTVDSLVFRSIATPHASAIKIEAVLNGKAFYSTVVLRGSY